jgi:hypothetical protein
MSIRFRETRAGALGPITAEGPDGSITGVIGEESPAIGALARLAAGEQRPESGEVESGEPRRMLGIGDALNLAPAATLVLEHALAGHDAVVVSRSLMGLERLRRSGASVLLVSHDEGLLASVCDEVWWLHEGRLAGKGDPREVLAEYRRHVAVQLRKWAESVSQPLAPTMRRGDGRAEIVSLQTLNGQGKTCGVWQSGEEVAVRVGVRFRQEVEDPVVGIMIRTRIGFEVFGTNTELERVKLGPVAAGESLAVTFRFHCRLCPQQYTLTAASHDPDGVWHDWMEDAVAFTVADTRYTAGVANLVARVEVERV